MDSIITLAIVDDHKLFREGLISVITPRPEFVVLIETDNGADLFKQLEISEQPDICLLDVNLPVMNGYEIAEKLKEQYPNIKILALSMFDNDYAMAKMLGCGVAGYLNKGTDIQKVFEALFAIHGLGSYNIDLLLESVKVPSLTVANNLPFVTAGESAFLRLCCTNATYSDMARQLNLSLSNIEGYRDVLYAKLEVSNRLDLVYKAISLGLYFNGSG